jgi:hypothetical protein
LLPPFPYPWERRFFYAGDVPSKRAVQLLEKKHTALVVNCQYISPEKRNFLFFAATIRPPNVSPSDIHQFYIR